MPPPMTTARPSCAGPPCAPPDALAPDHARLASPSARGEAEPRARRERGLDRIGHAHALVRAGVAAQPRGQLGEQVVGGGDRAAAVRRKARDDGGRGGEVGVDAVEHARRVDAPDATPEVVAAERALVVVRGRAGS